MKILNCIAGLILILRPALIAQDKNTVMKIEDAVRKGKITYDESLRLKHQFLHGHRDLPADYHSDSPVKCGFGIANELALKSKSIPALKIAKPSSDFMHVHQFTSQSQIKTFHVYYDTTGIDAVPRKDINTNGLPDWVEETALAMEKAYRTEVDTLGYREPLDFQIYGFYRVFISNQGGIYGGTTPDSQITSNPWTFTSYIEVDNDYIGSFYTSGYNALRVTCAHEFHHAVQLAYQNTYSSGDGWFYEVTSTWMEDVVYPEVNDYIDYLKYYFNQPQISLNEANGSHEYAMAIWNHYIQKKYSRLMIRRVWEKIPSMSALNGWNMVLTDSSNLNLSETYRDFTRWNYFTGYRSDTVHYYQEGYLYPTVNYYSTASLNDSLSYNTDMNLASSRWFRFLIFNQTNAEIKFSGTPSNEPFSMIVIKHTPGSNPQDYSFPFSSPIIVDNLKPSDTLTAILINKTWNAGDSYSFRFNIKSTVALQDNIYLKVYPNPNLSHSNDVNFSFRLFEEMNVFFEIFSISGKLIYREAQKNLSPGLYYNSNALKWNCRDMDNNSVPSGIYYYVFWYGKKSQNGKIAVIR